MAAPIQSGAVGSSGQHVGRKTQGRPNGKGKERERHNPRTEKRRKEEEELAELEEGLEAFDLSKPPSLFTDLPLSNATLKGLRSASYTTLTPIQSLSLPLALKGRDVLGAARTGSGKTLAFLIPMLELLLRQRWGPNDGLGALVISPTRELAVQIFDVLKKIGGRHSFSAGLVIGGKSLEDERERLSRMNILVATPGRLQQHMEQTTGFASDNLQLLVLDEADRILDMGFRKTLDAIVSNLPPDRQTLLFSATQTKSVKDLARLSLRDPEYVAAREAGVTRDLMTPKGLTQHYMVVRLEEKLDYLWTFIRTHLKAKIIVFLSSAKQVRFVYECFRHLRPGIPLLHLYGKQKQSKRLEIYQRFASSPSTCLFATDIAARGLDFPSVSWVVQADCPEDVDTYVHRVGRTARYESQGRALTFLLPSEEPGMKKRFEARGLDVQSIRPNEARKQGLDKKLQSLMFRFNEVKYLGQRAFISYVRSVYLQKDKEVFRFDELPLDAFAESLGLPGAPNIRLSGKSSGEAHKERKNKARNVESLKREMETKGGTAVTDDDDDDEEATADVASGSSDSDSSGNDGSDDDDNDSAPGMETLRTAKGPPIPEAQSAPQARTKADKMFQRQNQGVLSTHYNKLVHRANDAASRTRDDADDDFLTLKRVDHAINEEDLPASAHLSKRQLRKGVSKKAIAAGRGVGNKLVFDEEGAPHEVYELQNEDDFRKLGAATDQAKAWAEQEARKVKRDDVRDRMVEKEKREEKKRKRRARDLAERGDEEGAVLAGAEDADHVMPDFEGFDLPPLTAEEERMGFQEAEPDRGQGRGKKKRRVETDDDDMEARALLALQGR